VGDGFGFGVLVGVGVAVGVTVAVGVAVGVAVEPAGADEDGAADAGPAVIGSSSNPVAITAAPARANSRASRDTRLDRELKVFLAGVVGDSCGQRLMGTPGSHDCAASLRSLRTCRFDSSPGRPPPITRAMVNKTTTTSISAKPAPKARAM
jgi:hypothetical protein